MDTTNILADLRAERDRIALAITAIEALNGTSGRKRPGRKAAKVVTANVERVPKKKGGLTAAGRRRLSENMKRRWAERKKHAKKTRVMG